MRKFDIESFLPAPTVGEIKIDLTAGTGQNVIHKTVQQVYAISRDDFNTREILMVPEADRDKFFDELRKNYPVRREFQNTKIACTDKNIANVLAGLGFKVSNEK